MLHGLPPGLRRGHKFAPTPPAADRQHHHGPGRLGRRRLPDPIESGTWEVIESGPDPVVAFEAPHQLWQDLGQPGRPHLGLTAMRHTQSVGSTIPMVHTVGQYTSNLKTTNTSRTRR
ncbi:hypothetical protein A8926_4700 [Saccharopolyspora spinosa]|uniref:Uncharacterized protein n=1 Tax=Saccharopolyspora spinosa TaxID=60894 RepID=A0A2N3Y1U1_SACSN|nr:hypothetical protein A8926_4700 [Saccharopolyspora spinosa]